MGQGLIGVSRTYRPISFMPPLLTSDGRPLFSPLLFRQPQAARRRARTSSLADCRSSPYSSNCSSALSTDTALAPARSKSDS